MYLVATSTIVGADMQMTAEAVDYYRETLVDSYLGFAADTIFSCVDEPAVQVSLVVTAAFALHRTKDHVVLQSVLGSGVPMQIAFIVTDARIAAP